MKHSPSPWILLTAAVLFCGCGKAMVKPGERADGFSLKALRAAPVALFVDPDVSLPDLTPPFAAAFADRFGSPDSFSSYLAARMLDSLNHGKPPIQAALAPTPWPRHMVVVRELALRQDEREVPMALLPTGGQQSLQSAGGGTSRSWTLSFLVNVWEVSGRIPDEDGSGHYDHEGPGLADTTDGLLRHSFEVTATAEVPLYAYKTALDEAVRVAANKAVRYLRNDN